MYICKYAYLHVYIYSYMYILICIYTYMHYIYMNIDKFSGKNLDDEYLRTSSPASDGTGSTRTTVNTGINQNRVFKSNNHDDCNGGNGKHHQDRNCSNDDIKLIDTMIKSKKNNAEDDSDKLIYECDNDDISINTNKNLGKTKNLKNKKKLLLKPIDKTNLENHKPVKNKSYAVYRTHLVKKDKYQVRLHKSRMMSGHSEFESDNLIDYFKNLNHNENFEYDSILAGIFTYMMVMYINIYMCISFH